ncbi:hypothetical protein SADO_12258 [Salinisphaera dokdonensis CL-ES53]|uniref:Uncharacterized protein n=1 Tax=Salinisphaera dokdonensis CL-ES53 TaxID=1304272 RepID=A0ABV2B2A3_9GAMM
MTKRQKELTGLALGEVLDTAAERIHEMRQWLASDDPAAAAHFFAAIEDAEQALKFARHTAFEPLQDHDGNPRFRSGIVCSASPLPAARGVAGMRVDKADSTGDPT